MLFKEKEIMSNFCNWHLRQRSAVTSPAGLAEWWLPPPTPYTTSKMVLAFFENKGPINTNYVPRGTTVDAKYIVGALGKLMKVFNKKRPKIKLYFSSTSVAEPEP